MNKRVLLVFPHFNSSAFYGDFQKVAPSLPPISLMYLSSYLKSKGLEVKILDGQVENMDESALSEVVRDYEPGFVGITCKTPMYAASQRVARVVKENFPGIKTVMGGVHPTVLPDETMKEELFDYVVRGEGEETLHELVLAEVAGQEMNRIPGLTWRRNGRVVHNPDRPLPTDLDALPFPDLEGIPLNRYHQVPDAVFVEPIRVIITSRGCPYKCIFCSARQMSGYRYRARSAKNVVDEWEILVNEHGGRQVIVLDDNFSVNKQRAMDICSELIERGLHKKAVWTTACRADQVDLELCRKMKEAGCALISYGVESGTQRLLDLIQKGTNLSTIRWAVNTARKAGLKVRGTMILGLPTETVEETKRSIALAKELKLDVCKFSIATPYPGTALYQVAMEEGGFDNRDWSRFSSQAGYTDFDPVYTPKGRTPEDIKYWQRYATRSFYLRPRQLFHLVRNIKNKGDIAMYWQAAKSLMLRRKPKGAAADFVSEVTTAS